MSDGMTTKGDRPAIEVSAADLPLHCPRPDQTLWNSHPRVFLSIESEGKALCPYCGTHYVLKDWQAAGRKGH